MTQRSDDYYEGLKMAYKAVYKLFERCRLQDYKNAYQCALNAIDEEIEKANEDKPRIIVP